MEPIRFDFFDKAEFTAFLDSLPIKDAAKLLAVLDEVKARGLLSAERRQLVKKLETNLYEIRSKFSNNIQRAIYFRVEGSHYVITHGFTKKQQKTPQKEIKRAKQIRAVYQRRRDSNGRR